MRHHPPHSLTGRAEVFGRQAEYCDGRSPLYARLCRGCAGEPLVDAVAPEPSWDAPLRLLGAAHFLVLSGEAPELALAYAEGSDAWPAFRALLAERTDELAHLVREHGVQTNEVQRCFGLLPAFLSLGDGQPLDLVELGPSAGLNLLWDRYRYRYAAGSWGPDDGELVLSGGEDPGPPLALLERKPVVRRRLGIDLNPVDVTTDEGARLLQAFVWADQHVRLDRLRRAIEVLRGEPPELVQGDYVELLPEILERRDPAALTVVFQTASTMYLPAGRRERLDEEIRAAGERGPLAWLTTAAPAESWERGGYGLELQRWPDGERRLVGHFDFHGDWVSWTG